MNLVNDTLTHLLIKLFSVTIWLWKKADRYAWEIISLWNPEGIAIVILWFYRLPQKHQCHVSCKSGWAISEPCKWHINPHLLIKLFSVTIWLWKKADRYTWEIISLWNPEGIAIVILWFYRLLQKHQYHVSCKSETFFRDQPDGL